VQGRLVQQPEHGELQHAGPPAHRYEVSCLPEKNN